METNGRLLILAAIIGLSMAFAGAAEDKSTEKVKVDFDHMKNVAVNKLGDVARIFFDDDSDDIGSSIALAALALAGLALLLSICGAVLSLFLGPLLSNNNGAGLAVPTTGTVTAGTASVLPTTGRRRRSVDFYKHPVWNGVSEVLDTLYQAVNKYEKKN